MNISVSPGFEKDLQKLTKKSSQISVEMKRKLELFKLNPDHPSLRLHKLKGSMRHYWSISIKGNLRIIFEYIENGIILLDIGTHDDVY
jgi:addiction module RelE/StbE family toxin